MKLCSQAGYLTATIAADLLVAKSETAGGEMHGSANFITCSRLKSGHIRQETTSDPIEAALMVAT